MIYDRHDQIYKARIYRYEPQRLRWLGGRDFEFIGDNHTHRLHCNGEGWECSCASFQRSSLPDFQDCCHTIAANWIIASKPELAHA